MLAGEWLKSPRPVAQTPGLKSVVWHLQPKWMQISQILWHSLFLFLFQWPHDYQVACDFMCSYLHMHMNVCISLLNLKFKWNVIFQHGGRFKMSQPHFAFKTSWISLNRFWQILAPLYWVPQLQQFQQNILLQWPHGKNLLVAAYINVGWKDQW